MTHVAKEQSCSPLRVLVVEDELVFREGLRVLLAPFVQRVEIVGEAANATTAFEMARELLPDLVLLDLRLPEYRGDFLPDHAHGLNLIPQIRRGIPNTHVLILSSFHEQYLREVIFDALRAGAHGYIAKADNFDGAALVNAMHRVAQGEAIYGPVIAELIRDYHRAAATNDVHIERLTPREEEVLAKLACRKTDREIAEALGIKLRTVKAHVSNILAKLHVDSRYVIPYQHHSKRN